jgi:HPt (histidine-containing phosphotransfer) domain-containing protein
LEEEVRVPTYGKPSESEPPARPPEAPVWPGSLARLCAEELGKRLPVLLDAIKTGHCPTVHMEAHAMKGVAANFGLTPVAESLGKIEAAARAGDVTTLSSYAGSLPSQLSAALDTLLGAAA